ncbi:MAG: PQQ-binding-like beta-propeller repeat protein [Candidatus Bathyarchaeota archaeon]|nr:PQQ-binding-like beta-propeller repeat protein [Mycoplasmatota bacterium]MDG6221653.1 PQQ-binding-like beta-propeller repeat protein [Candidatus Bathyarchaeum tardum]
MEKNEKYTRISTIVLVLLLTASAISVTLPSVIAQNPVRNKQTYAFCTVTPNPIGVNQQALVWVGISDYLFAASDGWEGITVTVTNPAGNQDTLGPYRTDSTGSTGSMFIPDMVGTYTFQTHFPAQWYNWSQADVWYEASSSDVFELTVTAEQREYYPDMPLPNEYWSRPIDAQLRGWNTISGNWLWGASLNNYPYWNFIAPYNEYAPDSGHILWTKPITFGGLAGGALGPHAYDFGDAYEGYFLNSVIINGVLFYNRFQSGGGTRVEQEVVAVDLKSGEELWARNWNNTQLSFGQVFYWDSYNVHGAYAYLWSTSGSNWNAYDPATGRWVYGLKNVPSGSTHIYGPNGEILIYTVNSAAGWMTMWNSTLAVIGPVDTGSWIRNNKGLIFDAIQGIQWNKTIPTNLPGRVMSVLSDKIIGGTDDQWSSHLAILRGDYSQTFWCLNIEKGHEGELLFRKTWTPSPEDGGSAFIAASAEEGIFLVALKATRQLVALSLETGDQLWGPTEPQLPVDAFTIANWRRGVTSIVDGKVISGGMGGRVHTYDAQNGNLLWYYDAVDEHTEILWGDNWPLYLSFVANGKVYLHHAEHSPIDPMPRGAPFICLDLETGNEVWKMSIRGVHWGGYPIIGDSTIALFNGYDNRIYSIGKGPSSTTIVAPQLGIAKGSTVTIQGKVTDISPGTQEYAIKARFPEGVPAISDAAMSEWMNYVYMQLERPADATGVPVKIEIVDPNGEYAWIGTATTDVYGNYGYSFRPQVEGQYLIIATFEGSASYYGSTSTAYFAVDPAPTPSTPIDTQEPIDTQPPVDAEEPAAFITTEVAIIAAVAISAIIGVAAYWILRRK